MQQYVRIYYNKIVVSGINGELSEELATDLAPFGRNETPYEPSCSYDENFERFMVDAYECGFVRITPERAISVYQIKEFRAHNVAPKATKKATKKKPVASTRKKPVSKEIREGKVKKGGVNEAPILPRPEPPKGQGGKTC